MLRGWQCLLQASVGLQDGVDPVAELGDTGVHARRVSVAGAAAPGDDAHQVPGAVLLAHQRAPGVALHGAEGERRLGARGRRGQRGPGARTMQEVAPSAPAQIITSRMRKPQNSLHWVLVSRGRATCCSTAGVCEAAGIGEHQRRHRERSGNGERAGMGRGGRGGQDRGEGGDGDRIGSGLDIGDGDEEWDWDEDGDSGTGWGFRFGWGSAWEIGMSIMVQVRTGTDHMDGKRGQRRQQTKDGDGDLGEAGDRNGGGDKKV